MAKVTGTTKKALWFGLGSLVWMTIIANIPFWIVMLFQSVYKKVINISPWVGFSLYSVGVIFSLAGIYYSKKAYKEGEKGWELWAGLFPSILVLLLVAMFIIGEFVFEH